jgi:hypothetical protein
MYVDKEYKRKQCGFDITGSNTYHRTIKDKAHYYERITSNYHLTISVLIKLYLLLEKRAEMRRISDDFPSLQQ